MQKKEKLQWAKSEIEETLHYKIVGGIDFHIEADDENVKMYYTIPVLFDSIVQETTGVLPFVHHG